MKTLLLILILIASPAFAKVAAKPAAKPSVPMARQLTVQQDAELRDWITGIMHKADDATKRADNAEAAAKEDRAQTAISISKQTETQGHLTEIQTAYDKLQEQLAAALAKVVKLLKLANLFAWVIGIELALVVLLVCLKLDVPAIAPPWGIICTFAIPILCLGVVKLLPHVQ